MQGSSVWWLALLLSACASHELWMGRRCAGDCERDAAVVPVPDAAAPSDARACKLGRYQGSFEMDYRSGPAGVCGLFAQLGTAPAFGTLSFSLRGQERDGGVAFDDVCMRAGGGAPPDGGPSTPDIYATLAGSVDCASGLLQANLEGTYAAVSVCDIGIVRNDYFFRGTLSARYDRDQASFVDGQVRWEEPPVLLPPNPGGEGTWTAARISSTPELPHDCLGGVRFRDELFPDAGAP